MLTSSRTTSPRRPDGIEGSRLSEIGVLLHSVVNSWLQVSIHERKPRAIMSARPGPCCRPCRAWDRSSSYAATSRRSEKRAAADSGLTGVFFDAVVDGRCCEGEPRYRSAWRFARPVGEWRSLARRVAVVPQTASVPAPACVRIAVLVCVATDRRDQTPEKLPVPDRTRVERSQTFWRPG
jgi:hypothetical protein